MDQSEQRQGRLGTFGGVFTPTLLTILGVIMYLRLGWVIGNAGLLGGLLVMGLALGITTATGLALSSISTNTRLSAGGPYAIISRSLGLEVGGSVGVPLFISQALAVAMYVFGFREGWLWVFPNHSALLIDLLTFAGVFAIAYVSAEFAFRIQYVIMGVIAFSLLLILGSPAGWSEGHTPVLVGQWVGDRDTGFVGTDFWGVFAVFFPAATGIMAGANMSGDLENPRRSIPLGTMSAILVSTLIYVLLAVWVARAGTPEELTSNYTFLIDASLWGPGVIAGLLGATLSSALSSLVGAPRILVALVNDKIVPDIGGISQLSSSGEPRRAMIASGVLVLAALLFRDLNAIASLLSMFFLIAYATINAVVLIESSLGLQSYRPTLKIPRLVPLLGAVGCVFAMFIVNPTVSLVAVAVVISLYAFILRRGVHGRGDSRSGMFAAVAEWAATRATELASDNPRAWKPNLLVPVRDTSEVRGDFQFLHELARPEGTIKLLGIATVDAIDDVTTRMGNLTQEFRRKGVATTFSVIDSAAFTTGVLAGLQALRSAFFRPNILFHHLQYDSTPESDAELEELWLESRRLHVGLALLAEHPRAGLGKRSILHLWIPADVVELPLDRALTQGGLHLALLVGMRLHRMWGAEFRVVYALKDESQRPAAVAFAAALRDRARLSAKVDHLILVGNLEACMANAPQSDLDILGLPPEPDLEWVRKAVSVTRSACLFLGDSGKESGLA